MRRWLQSDLVGVLVSLLAVALFALTAAAFCVAGPLAGIVFSIPVFLLVYYFAFRREPTDLAEIRKGPAGHRHNVLVIADQGLEHPGLLDEVTRRGEIAETVVRVVAPVVASTPAHALADEIDREAEVAEARLEEAIKRLRERGIRATGRIDDEGDPWQALLDGLREFPANEVVMIPGAEVGWPEAELLGERIRREIGVPVTELGRSMRQGTSS
jgi:nucleotide-binding universal stress UspA family protein